MYEALIKIFIKKYYKDLFYSIYIGLHNPQVLVQMQCIWWMQESRQSQKGVM